MAERLRKSHQDDVRRKIQASQLINRLQNHALGKAKSEMTRTQVVAAKILLDKAVSNAPLELIGDPENPLHLVTTKRPTLTKAEWLAMHGVGTATGATE